MIRTIIITGFIALLGSCATTTATATTKPTVNLNFCEIWADIKNKEINKKIKEYKVDWEVLLCRLTNRKGYTIVNHKINDNQGNLKWELETITFFIKKAPQMWLPVNHFVLWVDNNDDII